MSGTGVAVIGWVSDGTTLGVKEYHDRRHDVPCRLGLAEDGVERCLPSTSGEVVFLDAACQDPVLLNSDSCSGEPTGYKQYEYAAGASCKAGVRVVQIGARTDPPPHWFTIDLTTGNCVGSTQGTFGRTFYDLSPVPASDWVAYKRTVTRVTSKLGVETFTGEDGSRIDGTLRLLPGDIECEPLASDGNPSTVAPNRCIPTARVHEAVYYTDSACGTPVTGGTPCDAPVIGERTTQANGCPAASYFDLGSAIPPAKLFWKLPDEVKGLTPEQSACVPANPSVLASGVYNQIGGDIDVTRYPLIEAKPEGTGRVQALFWVSDGIPLAQVEGTIGNDAPANQQCSLSQFGDSDNRCAFSLGGVWPGNKYYADAACMRPLFWMDVTLPSCESSTVTPRWVQEYHTVDQTVNGAACSTSEADQRVRPVLGEHKGQVYVMDSDTVNGSCTLLNPADLPLVGNPGQPEKLLFYDLGDPVDPGTLFAPITASEL
jgi:hypothetical protein